MHSFTIHLIEMRLWGAVVGCGELGGVGILQADMGEVITSLNKLFQLLSELHIFQQIIIKYVCYLTNIKFLSGYPFIFTWVPS